MAFPADIARNCSGQVWKTSRMVINPTHHIRIEYCVP
jgi:hypothetical protein